MCIQATELQSSKVWLKFVACVVFYVLIFSAFVLKCFRSENLEQHVNEPEVLCVWMFQILFSQNWRNSSRTELSVFFVFSIYLLSFFCDSLSASNQLQFSVQCHSEFNVFMCVQVSVIILAYNMVEILGRVFPEINARG